MDDNITSKDDDNNSNDESDSDSSDATVELLTSLVKRVSFVNLNFSNLKN